MLKNVKLLVIAFFACSLVTICKAQEVANPGEFHNEVMSEILNGNYKGNNSAFEYANAISQLKFGEILNPDQGILFNLRSKTNPADMRSSLDKYLENGLITSEGYGLIKKVIDYLYTWSDDEISPEEFNVKIDKFIADLNIEERNRTAFFTGIDVLKKSYEYQWNLEDDQTGNIAVGRRCKGFWRKLCIIAVDFIVAGSLSTVMAPPGAIILGALYSAAASCCGVCFPATQGCLDSNLCCITFGVGGECG